MLFTKDEASKFKFLSIKEFILCLVLMILSLLFFILIIPFLLSLTFPEHTKLFESINFRTLLSFPSLILNFYFIYYFVCKRKKKTLKDGFFLYPKSKEVNIKLLVIGFIMPLLSLPVLFYFAPKEYYAEDMLKQSGGIFFIIISSLIASVLEEVFYRGFIFPFLQSKLNSIWAVIITSVFFGISHYANVGNAHVLVGLFILYGFILTMIRYLTKSLIPPIIVHICHNCVLILGFIIGMQFKFLH